MRRASPYITASGYQMLDVELAGLWSRRKEVTAALSAAAAEGDRSENAEYIYRKKELAGIDRRIRYLQRRLDELEAVHCLPKDRHRVYFGAYVTLEDSQGETHRYRIVGSDELQTAKGWISIDSPMARALLRRQVDDEIRVDTPGGTMEYLITAIDYLAE